jgi:hypothetical protein
MGMVPSRPGKVTKGWLAPHPPIPGRCAGWTSIAAVRTSYNSGTSEASGQHSWPSRATLLLLTHLWYRVLAGSEALEGAARGRDGRSRAARVVTAQGFVTRR